MHKKQRSKKMEIPARAKAERAGRGEARRVTVATVERSTTDDRESPEDLRRKQAASEPGKDTS